MANAAFSPRDFKAWIVEVTDTGNNGGALDAPAITSGLYQLDVVPKLITDKVEEVKTASNKKGGK